MVTQNRAIVDKLLTNVSNKYVPTGYISERILPTINVKQSSGKLGKYGNNHIRVGSYVHSGHGPYPKVKLDNRLTQDYKLTKHALSGQVSEEDKQNVEAPFEAEVDETDDLTSLLWTEKEVDLAGTLGTTSLYNASNTVTLSGTDQYNDLANSTPLEDAVIAFEAIYAATGMDPNLMIVNKKVLRYLKIHPSLLDKLGYKEARPGGLTEKELADAFEVDEVLVGGAQANTAKEGQPDVFAPIWSNDLIFAVSPRTVAKRQVSLGYRLQLTNPRRVFKNAIQNPPNATEILIDDNYQQLISGVDDAGKIHAAYLIKNAVA
jgi:hypothetical protein